MISVKDIKQASRPDNRPQNLPELTLPDENSLKVLSLVDPKESVETTRILCTQKSNDSSLSAIQSELDDKCREIRQKNLEISALRKAYLGVLFLTTEDKYLVNSLHQPSDDLGLGRIRELAMKVKKLTVYYEKEKSKNMMLSKHVKTLESNYSGEKAKAIIVERPVSSYKLLQDKLSSATRKYEDEKLHNQSHKVEIRQLHQIIIQELGDGYSIENLLRADSSFKGRNEQILILKSKLKILKAKLSLQNTNDTTPSGNVSKFVGTENEAIIRIESSKKKKFEQLREEFEKSKIDLISLKSKNDGLSARNKTLEDHRKDMTSKFSVLLKKDENDDKLIRVLQNEIKKIRSSDVQKIGDRKIESSTEFEVALHGHSDGSTESIASMKSLKAELKVVKASNMEVIAQLDIERQGNIRQHLRHLESEDDRLEPKLVNSKNLVAKIGLLQDENRALKLSIWNTQQSKAEDLESYRTILLTRGQQELPSI